MTTRVPHLNRTAHHARIAALLAAGVAAGPAAFGQGCYNVTNYDVRHNFSIGPITNWARADGHWFGHTWAKYAYPVGAFELAKYSPGQYPGDPPAQSPTYQQFGLEKVIAGYPKNYCGTSPYYWRFPNDCIGFGTANPIALGTVSIPTSGTPGIVGAMGILTKGVAMASIPSSAGLSDFMVNPYGAATPMSGYIRTYGTYGTDPCGDMASYGFAFTELDVSGVLVPPTPPPFQPPIVNPPFTILYGLIITVFNHGGTAFSYGYVPPAQPSLTTARIYDPIKYTAVDQTTGQVLSGTPFNVVADVGLDGELTVGGGMLAFSGPGLDIFVTLSDARISQQGSYTLRVRNGMVVESSATGFFASAPPPPVGSLTPISVPFNDQINFALDLGGLGAHNVDFTASMSGGGVEPVAPLTCAAFSQQPSDTSACLGSNATLTAVGSGIGELSYQWWKSTGGGGWLPVFNGQAPQGSQVTGAQSATLVISGSTPLDGGAYQCTLIDGCGNATSQAATLTVAPCAPACYANCDQSVVPPILNVGDFTCFLQKYALGDAYANCDQSAVPPILNVADFTCFLQRYADGCH